MDIAGMWRNMGSGPTDVPHAGLHQQTAGEGITIDVSQECQVALPSGNRIPEIGVTITSNRPGVAAQVIVGANLNSPDGSYQGPTTTVGQGQFTAASSQVSAGFIVLPSGWPVLGVGAQATWADGTAPSAALTYVQLACDPWVWWRWLIPSRNILPRLLPARLPR